MQIKLIPFFLLKSSLNTVLFFVALICVPRIVLCYGGNDSLNNSADTVNEITIEKLIENQTVDAEDSELIDRFTTLETKNKFNFQFRSRFANELQPGYGYIIQDTSKRYLGSRPKIYNRAKFHYSLKSFSFSAGGLTEKDAGENNVADFYSGYLHTKSKSFLSEFLLGDYTVEFGQGLTLRNSTAYYKGSDAVSAVRKNDEINPYSSVDENQFFRGGIVKLTAPSGFGNFNFFGFYSDNKLDAAVDSLNQITSLHYEGYHRDSSEITHTNAAREKLYGGRFLFESGTASLGATYYRSYYDKDFKAKDIYYFSGNKSNGLGGDFNFVFGNLSVFGECARSYTGALGELAGARLALTSKKMSADLVLLLRNYPKDFIMLHSNAFGEQFGTTQNEFGIYSGIKFKLPKVLAVDAYIDQYKFPYRTYFKSVPTEGRDVLVFTEWKLSPVLSLYTKYKDENKENVIKSFDEYGREVNKIYSRIQKNYRLQFDYDLSLSGLGLRVRSRIEYTFVDYAGFKTSERGLLFFSDFRAAPFTGFSVDGRFVIFQTDSYDSRIYEFENELTGSLYNPSLYGKGRRWYLLIRYKPVQHLECSAKYSETFFDGVKSIGSGKDEITGDFKNRLELQLDVNF